MRPRAGTTLVELLATLVVMGLVAAACAGLVRAQAQLLRHTAERAAALETLRAARTVLRAEARDIAGPDRYAVAADSLALRVFRGFGIVCSARQQRYALRYRGVRLPDAAKDSILLLGAERAGSLLRVGAAGPACSARTGEQVVTVDPDLALQLGAVVLFFESGAYHLAAGALRYRRGSGGMQPITEDLIDHAASGFALDTATRMLGLTLRSGSAAGPGFHEITRFRLRNP